MNRTGKPRAFYIPIGKALIAEESNGECAGCVLLSISNCKGKIACGSRIREDRKSVKFKLVDWLKEVSEGTKRN